mmetsp:Transcript_35803/g.101994  ORF Transcript_35803/g.101994 Transcript_35803/m.101994 type:complete len:86 (+) Transcript_35803:487-744(+)
MMDYYGLLLLVVVVATRHLSLHSSCRCLLALLLSRALNTADGNNMSQWEGLWMIRLEGGYDEIGGFERQHAGQTNGFLFMHGINR